MNHQDHRDERIRELFRESRRADHVAAPSYRSLLKRARRAPRFSRPRIGVLAVATASATAALALAFLAIPRLERRS